MQYFRNATPQVAIHRHHLRDGRLVGPYEGIAHFAHYPAHRAIVDVGICTVQIAHRFCQATIERLEDKPLVLRIGTSPRHSEAKFERHVETGRAWSAAIELDSREIMNRIRAALDQCGNTVQPAVTSNAKRRPRKKAHRAQGGNVGKISTLELLVVGDIEEYALLFGLGHGNERMRPAGSKILIENLGGTRGLTSQLVTDNSWLAGATAA